MLLKNVLFAFTVLLGALYLAFEVFPGVRGFPETKKATDIQLVQDVASEVDREFSVRWKEKGIESSEPADDLLVARRLALGLTGTVPSLEEIRKFENVDAGNRIDWWTRYLLNDQRYADYVAERLARGFVGTENGPFIVYRRRRFVMWLSEQLAQNRPYNELVKDLITESGLWTDTPSVNFYTVTMDTNNGRPDPIRLAARTTRAFLGLRIDCLQCHDDALGTMELGDESSPRGGTQEDFHQLAAAFASVRQTAAGLQDAPGKKKYEFKVANEDSQRVASFGVPFRRDLLPKQGSSRSRLSGWITHADNQAFSRAIVNRVWAIMTGKPLYYPIDDIPLFGNRPPGMDLLAEDLVENGFDLRRLIRIIAQTEAYRKSSNADFAIGKQHESNWAVFPQTPLRPEQVAGSMVQSTSLTTINDDSNVFQKISTFSDVNDFIVRYGDGGESEFQERNGTIQQKNIMMNGKVVAERTKANGLLIDAAGQISRFAESNEKLIESLFLVVLTRRPTENESRYLLEMLDACQNQQQKNRVTEDIFWTLFNKLEFQRNH